MRYISFEEETGKERRERAMGLESHPVPSRGKKNHGIFETKLQERKIADFILHPSFTIHNSCIKYKVKNES
jgi:hypothetical protein|eukprot:scaffold1922_cov291-Chaetoceros_neogracile.AAC.19